MEKCDRQTHRHTHAIMFGWGRVLLRNNKEKMPINLTNLIERRAERGWCILLYLLPAAYVYA